MYGWYTGIYLMVHLMVGCHAVYPQQRPTSCSPRGERGESHGASLSSYQAGPTSWSSLRPCLMVTRCWNRSLWLLLLSTFAIVSRCRRFARVRVSTLIAARPRKPSKEAHIPPSSNVSFACARLNLDRQAPKPDTTGFEKEDIPERSAPRKHASKSIF